MAPPRNREPVSPINTFAGLKLYIRKPTRPPARPDANMPSSRNSSPHATVTQTKNRHTGTEVPLARPVTPSVIFTALTVPTIINAANTKYSHSGMGTVLLKNGI